MTDGWTNPPNRGLERRVRRVDLVATMPPNFVASRDNRCAARSSSCVFWRINRVDGAPRRCAFAAVAPQQRRNASPRRRIASLTSLLNAASRFVTESASRVGGRNSARFLSMQRPKPVDIGRPLSGFLSQDSREHSHTSGGKRMNKKESRRAGICNRTSTSVVRELSVPPLAAVHLKRSELNNHGVGKGLTLVGISVNGSTRTPVGRIIAWRWMERAKP